MSQNLKSTCTIVGNDYIFVTCSDGLMLNGN